MFLITAGGRETPVSPLIIPVVTLAYIRQRQRQKARLTRGYKQRVEENVVFKSNYNKQNLSIYGMQAKC